MIKKTIIIKTQVLELIGSGIGMGEDLPSLCPDRVGLRRPPASEDIFIGKGGKRSVRDLLRQKEIAGMTGP